jgi:carbon starvation protein
MNALWIVLGATVLLWLAYRSYGRFLARRVFPLDDSEPTPAHTLRDGRDYVPAPPLVLFGHHFASIAGLGPLLGPAIAVIWGWVPALLWILLGCILIGAVHDLGCLYSSIRNRAADGRRYCAGCGRQARTGAVPAVQHFCDWAGDGRVCD